MTGACPWIIVLAQTVEAAASRSWLDTINSAGPIGYIIMALSMVAMTMVVMHLVQIRRRALLPPEQIDDLDAMLARGDVAGALQYSLDPERDSYLTRIMAAGLTRYERSAFGAFEIKNAIEEAGEEQTARLYRSTDALSVIGAISPLLGLLGTVQGMVGAFDVLAQGATDHERLAANISLALVTTLLGLTLAIPCVALYTYFRNRIDTFASEAGTEIERLVLHLESGSPGRRTGAGPIAAGVPGRGGAGPRPAGAAGAMPAPGLSAPPGAAMPALGAEPHVRRATDGV